MDSKALKEKLDAYRLEWNTYDRLIHKVDAMRSGSNAKSAA
jgi:hypothetical protein